MPELLNCRIANRSTREELTKLTQRIFSPPSGTPPGVVVFSGVEGGVGTSSICAFLAEVLVEQINTKTILVDANLRHPHLHEFFGLDGKSGLANAIEGKRPAASFLLPTAFSGLSILPAGIPQGDLHPLLSSRELPGLFSELRSIAQLIIVDSPPILQYADASLLGRIGDGMVMVIGANATRREVARKAKNLLESAQIHLFGTVLNKRVFPIPAILYGII
jgi:protein-tyrosine kinase